jgi:hypothetical protein
MDEGNQMVERVARALCARHGNPNRVRPSAVITKIDHGALGVGVYASLNGPQEPAWKGYEAEARTAIEAMRQALEAQPRYSTPLYDDIGMQADESGDWVRLSELPAALTPPPSGEM